MEITDCPTILKIPEMSMINKLSSLVSVLNHSLPMSKKPFRVLLPKISCSTTTVKSHLRIITSQSFQGLQENLPEHEHYKRLRKHILVSKSTENMLVNNDEVRGRSCGKKKQIKQNGSYLNAQVRENGLNKIGLFPKVCS